MTFEATLDQPLQANLVALRPSDWQLALKDIKDSFEKWRIWLLLAHQDIKLRYRRSTLGPFWLTLSMAITIYSMGFLYSRLLQLNVESYFPFLAAGMIAWTLISSTITDLTDTFAIAEGVIKQIKLPYTLYIHQSVWRNFLIFFHNLVVMVPILLIYHEAVKINLNTLLIIPGLMVVYVNGYFYGTILAMVGTRFRDVSQIIKSLVQVVFFITPVMWNPATLSDKFKLIAHLNPFYAYVELIRAPLMGMCPAMNELIMATALSLFGIILMVILFPKYRARIIYWL